MRARMRAWLIHTPPTLSLLAVWGVRYLREYGGAVATAWSVIQTQTHGGSGLGA
jgi:hypothetical protein